MLGYLIAIRNFIIAVVLAWIGMELAPADHDKESPAEPAPADSVLFR